MTTVYVHVHRNQFRVMVEETVDELVWLFRRGHRVQHPCMTVTERIAKQRVVARGKDWVEVSDDLS